MKPRLARPLLAAIVGGALAAGGAVAASPAFAGSSPVRAAVAVEESPSTDVSPSPTDSTPADTSPSPADSTSADTSPSPSEGTSESPSASPSVSESASESPSASPSVSPPTPDTIPPKGVFKLSATSIWTGQQVKFTQTSADYSDNVTPDSAIKRTVNWGDGSAVITLTASQTVLPPHNYTKPGTFTVVERLTDQAGKFTDIKKAVKVSNTWAKVTNSKTSVWHGQRYYVTVKSVPAGVQYVMVQNGDNCTVEFKWTGKAKAIPMIFWKDCATGKIVTGKRYAKVKYRNANGYTSWITSGPAVALKKDSWKPTVTITKPKNANKLSAWKTVTGTAKDKGAGVRVVWVGLQNYSNGQNYCLNNAKKWQKFNTDADYTAICRSWRTAVSAKGKWTFKVPAGLKKGYVWPTARPEDWSGKYGNWKYIEAKITRS